MRTLAIAASSPHLDSVRRLWRQNSETLGFFPQGAFEDHAKRGGIIVALDDDDGIAGYIVLRRTRRKAVIVHLCVDRRCRGCGVARLLIDAFRNETSDMDGASVTCRADFEASSMWPRLGFVALRDEPAKEPHKRLKRWWLDYGKPSLFAAPTSAALAVIDANVFFDLLDPEHPRSIESTALTADWLTEAFTLAVTPEVYNEIDRCGDPERRERARGHIHAFVQAIARPHDLDEAIQLISRILGVPRSPSDRSDHRQLAHAVSVGAAFFVTRDGDFLNRREELEAKFSIQVVRPAEIVCKHDEDVRPQAYAPARLDGSSLEVRRIRSEELSEVIRVFQNFPRGEQNNGLPATLRSSLARPGDFDVDALSHSSGVKLAIQVSSVLPRPALDIIALRIVPGVLGTTVARYALWRTVQRATAAGARMVRFLDSFASDGVEDGLKELGFVRGVEAWSKPLLYGRTTIEGAVQRLDQLSSDVRLSNDQLIACAALATASAREPVNAVRFEKLIWPGRVFGSGIPCFIVPIKPRWARALFDTRSAAGRLFGADPSLLLRFENAYFRGARPGILEAPARVLWYCSHDPTEQWSKHICGTALLNRVVIDSPKATFQEFKHYGVFTWKDVSDQSTDSKGRIMAFTFSHSALLQRPIPYAEAAAHLRAVTGKHYTFQSPLRLEEELWLGLAELGEATETASA